MNRFPARKGVEPQRFSSKRCNFFGCNQMQKVATLKPNAETKRSFIETERSFILGALHIHVNTQKSGYYQ